MPARNGGGEKRRSSRSPRVCFLASKPQCAFPGSSVGTWPSAPGVPETNRTRRTVWVVVVWGCGESTRLAAANCAQCTGSAFAHRSVQLSSLTLHNALTLLTSETWPVFSLFRIRKTTCHPAQVETGAYFVPGLPHVVAHFPAAHVSNSQVDAALSPEWERVVSRLARHDPPPAATASAAAVTAAASPGESAASERGRAFSTLICALRVDAATHADAKSTPAAAAAISGQPSQYKGVPEYLSRYGIR